MAKVVGVGVADGILEGVLGSNISVNRGWGRCVSRNRCRSIGWSRCRCVDWLGSRPVGDGILRPGDGNSGNSRKGKDLRT